MVQSFWCKQQRVIGGNRNKQKNNLLESSRYIIKYLGNCTLIDGEGGETEGGIQKEEITKTKGKETT